MKKLIAAVGPFTLELRPGTPFQGLMRSIVYQQLAGRAAAAIHGRLLALFPRKRATPDRLLALSDAQLRGAGLSGSKMEALRDLARNAGSGVVPTMATLKTLSDEQIVERLTEVRGIGQWTVEMLLIFRLGRPDVLPVDDYGVRKGFARAYRREMPKPKELLTFGEIWRPFRSVASWYLWRAVERDW